MPPVGWLNDPNGLCWFRGEYHVFFQYSPFDPEGGVKFWGHYKSRNLMDWEYCPVMLYSDEAYEIHGAYSGSALCEEDGMYLYYTGNVKHGGDFDYIRSGRENNTVLAYSPDGMQVAWKRLLLRNGDYPAGLTCHVRDPKVWKQDGKYYMVLGARSEKDTGEVLVLESGDRLNWRHMNTLRTPEAFGYMWECPDLFELDGQWFLLVSPQGVEKTGSGFENKYACGYFPLYGDFRSSCTLGAFVPLDFGFDFYAPQSFRAGGRRLLIGWMGMPDAGYQNPTIAQGWQHALTVTREVTCVEGKLRMRPVKELESLREHKQELEFSGRSSVDLPTLSDILIDCEGDLTLELSGVCLKAEQGTLTMTISSGGYGRDVRTAPSGGIRNLRVLADTSALEIFVNDGKTVLTTRWYPKEEQRTLVLRGKGRAFVYSLRPMRIERCEAEWT